MATRRTEAPAVVTAAIETASATVIVNAIGTVDIAIEAVDGAATRPAITEKTHRAAMPEATRVGVEVGAAILADTHVVTEVEMAISIGAATAEAAPVPVLLTAITVPAATTAVTAMIAATAVVTTIGVAVLETALHATLRLRRSQRTSAIVALSSSSSSLLA